MVDEALGVQTFMDKHFTTVSDFNSNHYGRDIGPEEPLIRIEFDVKLQFIWKPKMFLNCQKIRDHVMPRQGR